MKTILILGAHGRLGSAAVRAYAHAGWRVLAQVRRPGAPLPAQILSCPLADSRSLADAARGADVVLHAVNPPYTQWGRVAIPLLQQGLDITRRLGARFLLPGNVYNFGAGMPPLLDENTPQHPTTRKGRLRFTMEEQVRASGLDAVIVRAGDYFGAGRGSWLDLVVARDLARGRLVYPGPRDQAHAWAYLPDLARVFVALSGRPLPQGTSVWTYAGYTLTGNDLLAALQQAAQRLGLAPPAGFRTGNFPWPLLSLARWVHPMSRELVEMSYLWREPHALDGRRMQATLGSVPQTGLIDALTQSLLDLGYAGPQAAGDHRQHTV